MKKKNNVFSDMTDFLKVNLGFQSRHIVDFCNYCRCIWLSIFKSSFWYKVLIDLSIKNTAKEIPNPQHSKTIAGSTSMILTEINLPPVPAH